MLMIFRLGRAGTRAGKGKRIRTGYWPVVLAAIAFAIYVLVSS